MGLRRRLTRRTLLRQQEAPAARVQPGPRGPTSQAPVRQGAVHPGGSRTAERPRQRGGAETSQRDETASSSARSRRLGPGTHVRGRRWRGHDGRVHVLGRHQAHPRLCR